MVQRYNLHHYYLVMKKNLNKLKKSCNTCFNDANNMLSKIKNRDPKEIKFEEAKKIFIPLKNKIR